MSRSDYAAAYLCLAAVVLNHSLFRLGAMPVAWAAVLLAMIAAVGVLAPDIRLRSASREPLRWTGIAIGLVALAPLAASVVLGWTREFAFGGDQSFHIKQAIYMAFWWLSPAGSTPLGILGRALDADAVRELLAHPAQLAMSRAVVLAVIVAATLFIYRRNRLAALAVAALALAGWGLCEHAIYLRYPGAWYTFAAPFLAPALLAGNLELAGRLTSAAAAVAWLFMLRPYLLGRWPDVRILPGIALLLWHKDALYFFDAAYLEAWTVVFVLLAVELLIARGREGAPVACLMIGLAAATKEPPILALPFVWLAGMPWRGPWQDRARLLGAPLAAGFPFVLYFAARRSVDIQDLVTDRSFRLDASLNDIARFAGELFSKMSVAFSGTGLAIAAIALVAIPVAMWMRESLRVPLGLLVMAGVAIALFFALDRNSMDAPGEFRFFLYSFPLLAAGVVALGYALPPRRALALGMVMLMLQVPNAARAISRSAGWAPRSFTEFYDTPIVFPLKAIVADAKAQGLLRDNTIVIANALHEGVRPVPGTPVEFGPIGELYCECSASRPAALALFVRYVNYSARFAGGPPGDGEVLPPLYRARDLMWRRQLAERPACVAKLRATCAHVFERREQGDLVAVLGVR